MSSDTVYLITGANRGIGFGLTRTLLLRTETTVIATVRSSETSTVDLKALSLAEGSKLIIAFLDFSDPSPAAIEKATEALHATLTSTHKISHINTIIANAGVAWFSPTLTTPLSSVLEHVATNTVGPISLFQSLFPLLSTPSKFILISSALGSIGQMEGGAPTLAYGVSKAGANFFVRLVHFQHESVTSLAVHPGWVKTGNGQNFADSIGVLEPPMTLEASVKGALEQIDSATKATTSGSFVSYDGATIPW